MAIIKKADLQRHIQELVQRYQELRKAVFGTEPNENIYEHYSNNPDEYKRDFTEVDITSVEYALHDFKGVLKLLEHIKKLQVKQLTRQK